MKIFKKQGKRKNPVTTGMHRDPQNHSEKEKQVLFKDEGY